MHGSGGSRGAQCSAPAAPPGARAIAARRVRPSATPPLLGMERDKRERDCCFPRMQERGGGRLRAGGRWSSSVGGPTADALGSTRKGQASTRSILSRHLRNRKPPFSSSGDSCALGGTLSLTRLRTRGRMGVTGRKHPMLGVLCWCGTRQPPRGGSVRRNRTVKAVPLIVMEGTSRSVRPDAGWHALRIGGPSMTAADGCSLDTARAVG